MVAGKCCWQVLASVGECSAVARLTSVPGRVESTLKPRTFVPSMVSSFRELVSFREVASFRDDLAESAMSCQCCRFKSSCNICKYLNCIPAM